MSVGKKIVIGAAAIGVALFLFLKFYGGALVKTAVETYGSAYTGTSVTVADISFSPLWGRFGFAGLKVGNPPGYKGETAFSLSEMRADLETSTLFSEVVRIRALAIVDPEFAVEIKKGKINAKAILDHMNQYAASREGETRVQIESLSITGGRIALSGLPANNEDEALALPDIHLTDIGTGSENGVSFAEASAVVMEAVVTSVTRVVAENKLKGVLGGISDKVKGLFGGDDEGEDDAEEGN